MGSWSSRQESMRIWKQIICVEMFFVASVKKSPYLHTIVVASLVKKLALLKVARPGTQGEWPPRPGPAAGLVRKMIRI